MHVNSLARYPLKGFSPEMLEEVTLNEGGHFPFDRLWAVENGASHYDGKDHLSKTAFLCLMKQAKIAQIKTSFNPKREELSLKYQHEKITASLNTPQGCAEIEVFLTDILRSEGIKPLKVLKATETMRFTDSRRGFISLINLETIKSLEKETGKTIDPIRFRGNIMIEGLPAFEENNLRDFRLQIGDCLFRVLKRIDRCGATTVNLDTGLRDIMIPQVLNRTYGHVDFGIYLEAMTSGTIEKGQRLRLHPPPQMDLPFA